MTDLERFIRLELHERADSLTPAPGWTEELVRRTTERDTRRWALTWWAVAASVTVAALVWGLTQRGDNGLVEPAPPPPTGVPRPADLGAVSFLGTAGTGDEERLYELTQQVDCDTGCGRSLWSTDEAGRTHLHDFTADQDVYAVFMDGEGTAGLAFGSGETRVVRTADGGRSWTPVEQVFAPYGFPPDVVFLDGSIYLFTVQWSGGPSEDDSQHLWRSSVDSEEWTEVALPDTAGRGFVYALDSPEGPAAQLLLADADTAGDTLGWTFDGSTWSQVTTTVPCDPSQQFVTGPASELYLWCPAEGGGVSLQRSLALEPFDAVGSPIPGRVEPPHLVGPFPVRGINATEHPVLILVDGEGQLLLDSGPPTPVDVPPALTSWADTASPGLVAHLHDATYIRAPDGSIAMTVDGGRSWVSGP